MIERQVSEQEQAECDGDLFPALFHFISPIWILIQAAEVRVTRKTQGKPCKIHLA
jgi:hypothetical protein